MNKDSLIAIRQFVQNVEARIFPQLSIQRHILSLPKHFEKYSFHVLKSLNGKVDQMANLGIVEVDGIHLHPKFRQD